MNKKPLGQYERADSEGFDNFTRIIEGKKVLPPDYYRKVRAPLSVPLTEDQWIQRQLLENSKMFASTFALDRGLTGVSTSVTTTPVRLIQARALKGYILSNPTISTGKANSGTLLASSARANGGSENTTSTPLDVSDYSEVRLFLDISANASANVVTINTLTKDPVSGNWATAQSDVFTSQTAVGTYYETIGRFGVDANFAISWAVSAIGGTTTFSVGYILKDASAAFSLANVIYLGSGGVTVESGYPLLEGHELRFYLRPNVELWGVSNVASGLSLKIFELQ